MKSWHSRPFDPGICYKPGKASHEGKSVCIENDYGSFYLEVRWALDDLSNRMAKAATLSWAD
jgi:hypothetical protein